MRTAPKQAALVRIQDRGPLPSLSVLKPWARRMAPLDQIVHCLARQMTAARDQLSEAETVTVAAIESGVEPLVEAREVVADFQAMIRRKAPAELDPWIAPRSPQVGPTAKPKVKSASSSWSSARCMDAEEKKLLAEHGDAICLNERRTQGPVSASKTRLHEIVKRRAAPSGTRLCRRSGSPLEIRLEPGQGACLCVKHRPRRQRSPLP